MSTLTILPTLSVCLIVKDESHTLSACLQSVVSIADQLVVIDTGSQDHSPAIAAAYGAEVHHFPWQDDFSAARNVAIAKATMDWILFLDADEVFIHPESGCIQHFLKNITRRFPGLLPRLQVQIQNLNDDGQIDSVHSLMRLFPNQPGFAYQGRIHEQLHYQGPGDSPVLAVPQVCLVHSGYTSALVKVKNKAQRNTQLILAQMQAEPEQPYWHSYLADSLLWQGTEAAEQQALKHYAQAVEGVSETHQNSPRFIVVLSQYLKLLLRLQGAQAALSLVEQYLHRRDLTPDFLFLSGETYLQLACDTQAMACFERCLRLSEAPDKIKGAYTLACLQQLPLTRLVRLSYDASFRGDGAAVRLLQHYSQQLLALGTPDLEGVPVYLYWVVAAYLQDLQDASQQTSVLRTAAEQGLWAAWQSLRNRPPEAVLQVLRQHGLSHSRQLMTHAEDLWKLNIPSLCWLLIGLLFLSSLEQEPPQRQANARQMRLLLQQIGQSDLARQLKNLLHV